MKLENACHQVEEAEQEEMIRRGDLCGALHERKASRLPNRDPLHDRRAEKQEVSSLLQASSKCVLEHTSRRL